MGEIRRGGKGEGKRGEGEKGQKRERRESVGGGGKRGDR